MGRTPYVRTDDTFFERSHHREVAEGAMSNTSTTARHQNTSRHFCLAVLEMKHGWRDGSKGFDFLQSDTECYESEPSSGP